MRTAVLFSATLLAACDVSSTVGSNETALSTSSCSQDSAISACSAEPCVITDIGNGREGSWAIAADGEHVFFERTTNVLAKVLLGGGEAVDVRTDLDRMWAAAVDANYVYTTEFERGTHRVRKTGGPSELVMHPKGHPTAIALDRDNVYVTMTDENQIAMSPKAGGQPTLLAGQSAPQAIAVDEQHVYWVNQGIDGGSSGELVRAPLGDLTGAEVVLSGLNSPRSVAVGGDVVFFGSPSQVFQVSKTGGDAELVVDSFDEIKSLVAYGDTVFLAGMGGFARARRGAATQVVDSRGMLGIAATCRGVFATGWLQPLLVRYGR
jgi:hypothetical protein